MRALPLLALLALPLIEIALFALAGDRIGVGPTIGLTVATTALGLLLLRRQGIGAARRMAEGSAPPAPALADAAGRALAAILLVIPGFLTDAIGLLLLVPAIRRLLAAAAWGYLRRHVHVVVATDGPAGFRPPGGGPIIDGDATVVHETRPAPPAPPTLPPPRPDR